jgi:hypothetical protein
MGYTLGQTKAYLAAVAQEEARRDRDRLVLMRAALSGSPESFRELFDQLDALTRTNHG